MKDYNQELDILFEEWKNESEIDHFYMDGLMYRGQKDESETWRFPGNESEIWAKAPKRIMFLMKDVNARGDTADDDDDIRGRIFKNTSAPIYRKISYLLYGLLKTTENNHIPEYTFFIEESTMLFDETPIAYVNCKKAAGSSSVSNSSLWHYLQNDKENLIQQINLLDPDIIICCAWTESGGNPIFDFVKDNICKNLIKINNWIYYSKEENKLVINSYHPTSRVISGKDLYWQMMEAYKEFLDKYPNFKKSCR